MSELNQTSRPQESTLFHPSLTRWQRPSAFILTPTQTPPINGGMVKGPALHAPCAGTLSNKNLQEASAGEYACGTCGERGYLAIPVEG